MKKEFDRILKMSLVSWIAFIILGIFLFIKAELTLKIISYIVGGTLLLSIIPLTKALISKDAVYTSYSFISEIFMVVAGLIIILNTELIASIIPILIGIVMIINGVSKIQFSLVLKRENIRLELSIKDGIEKYGEDKEIIVCMHYPPFNNYKESEMNFIATMKKYNVKTCIYGHLHGEAGKEAKQGKIDGIDFKLASCDQVEFKLQKI